MKKTRSFLLAAGISLALAFTFSCSSDDGEPSGGNTSSSSVVGGSSSSVVGGGGGSSSSDGNGGSNCSANFKTTTIGTQTWMAENLNCDIEGSKCYQNNDDNCVKYGRLYDWATAMGLPPNCNDGTCASQVQTKHKGICPSGWHIPSNEDWDKLYRFADGTSGTESPYGSPTAGGYLKATSGWNNNGNGTDAHGFSALPGGGGPSDGYLTTAGDYGHWWSASEDYSDNAYSRNMTYSGESANWNYYDKSYLFSVRCLQD